MPVVVDNHAMREILWQSLTRISELRQQAEQSEKQIEVYKVQVTQLTENLDQAEQRLEVAKQGIRELQTIYNQEVDNKVQSIVAKYDKETHELRQTIVKQVHDTYSDLSVEQLAERIVQIHREKTGKTSPCGSADDVWHWISDKSIE